MKRAVTSVVGGPLLASSNHAHAHSTNPLSWTTQAPLLHDPWILLPSATEIVILAAQTGERVGRLNVGKELRSVVAVFVVDNDDNDTNKDEATLIVWVGCKDASLVEFVLTRTALGKRKPGDDALLPRRTLVLSEKEESIVQLAAVQAHGSLLLYALLEQDQVTNSGNVQARLVRVQVKTVTTETTKSPNKVVVPLYDTKNSSSEDASLHVLHENMLYPSRHAATSKSQHQPTASAPFRLVASRRKTCILVLLATRSNLTFYVDLYTERRSSNDASAAAAATDKDYTTLPRVTMEIKGSPLTTVAMAPSNHNGNNGDSGDVACGHVSGAIRILDQLGTAMEHYARKLHAYKQQQQQNDSVTTTPKPVHPSKTVLVRKLHWHAHPVSSLVYDLVSSSSSSGSSSSVLYSGGEESVLAVWQLNGAFSKPAHTLPRLGLQGIVHLDASARHVLVYSADNSLQLIESHNLAKQWHVQGLAAGVSGLSSRDGGSTTPLSPQMWLDPHHKNCLAMTGLSQAPGQVHWYHAPHKKVVQTLAATPFNRVSRTEPGDVPLPPPRVTLSAVSRDDLVTVDQVATENPSAGVVQPLEDDKQTTVSVVTTLRFWSSSRSSYHQVAAMAHPHGRDHAVSAVALSPHGRFACTVSNSECAFYLWQKTTTTTSSGPTMSDDGPLWTCRYRVSMPAGYSQYATPVQGVAFSQDSSTLAIAVGSQVTLWDHGNVTFLSALRLEDDDTHKDNHNNHNNDTPIQSIAFLSNASLTDMLLIQTSTGVHLRSPFGEHSLEGLGWTWKLPFALAKRVRVTQACFLGTNNLVAMVLYHQEKDATRVVLVDAVTGAVHQFEKEDAAVVDGIAGQVVAVCNGTKDDDDEMSRRKTGWSASPAPVPLELYMLTASGELLLLHSGSTTMDLPPSTAQVDDEPSPVLPTIPLLAADYAANRKRPLAVMQVSDLEPLNNNKKLALDRFGAVEGETTTEFPSLRGAFARAFVGRYLQQR